ncbi:MAG: hypothetical protein II716_00630 [Treponema sp.]|nr:hypothetical protein [Treponema sp.]
MKKSLKFLFGALIVGAVMTLTSCADLLGLMIQAGSLFDKIYTSGSWELTFDKEQAEGSGYYRLIVKRNGSRIDNDTIQWMLDTSATQDGRVKDVYVYKSEGSGSSRTQIGTLRPDTHAADKLTVTGGSIQINAVSYISNGTEFTKQN